MHFDFNQNYKKNENGEENDYSNKRKNDVKDSFGYHNLELIWNI